MSIDQIQWAIIYAVIIGTGLVVIAVCQMAGKWDDAEGANEEDDEEQQDIIEPL